MLSETFPRLLDHVRLAQPLEEAKAAIFAWAGCLGLGAFYTYEQLETLSVKAEAMGSTEGGYLSMDVRVARGTITALERRPRDGWEGYVRIWNELRVKERTGKQDITDFARLRELEGRCGGILLNNRACPLMLILPQPDGTWVQMGWESMVQLDRSPLAANRDQAQILQEIVLPAEERTIEAAASP